MTKRWCLILSLLTSCSLIVASVSSFAATSLCAPAVKRVAGLIAFSDAAEESFRLALRSDEAIEALSSFSDIAKYKPFRLEQEVIPHVDGDPTKISRFEKYIYLVGDEHLPAQPNRHVAASTQTIKILLSVQMSDKTDRALYAPSDIVNALRFFVESEQYPLKALSIRGAEDKVFAEDRYQPDSESVYVRTMFKFHEALRELSVDDVSAFNRAFADRNNVFLEEYRPPLAHIPLESDAIPRYSLYSLLQLVSEFKK